MGISRELVVAVVRQQQQQQRRRRRRRRYRYLRPWLRLSVLLRSTVLCAYFATVHGK